MIQCIYINRRTFSLMYDFYQFFSVYGAIVNTKQPFNV